MTLGITQSVALLGLDGAVVTIEVDIVFTVGLAGCGVE